MKKHPNVKWYVQKWDLLGMESRNELHEQVAQVPMLLALLPLLCHILMLSLMVSIPMVS